MASFTITKDIIGDGDFDGKMFGDKEYLKAEKAKHKFRIYDDDDELYYEGVSGNSSCDNPLMWAMGNDGCTWMEYLNEKTNKWETL